MFSRWNTVGLCMRVGLRFWNNFFGRNFLLLTFCQIFFRAVRFFSLLFF